MWFSERGRLTARRCGTAILRAGFIFVVACAPITTGGERETRSAGAAGDAIDPSGTLRAGLGDLASEPAFVVTVGYLWEAKDRLPVRFAQTKAVFSPERLGLRPGNGSRSGDPHWAGLANRLVTWSKMTALNSAAKRCGGLERISHFRVLSANSGSWRVRFPLQGHDYGARVISPLAGRSRLNRSAQGCSRRFSHIPRIRTHGELRQDVDRPRWGRPTHLYADVAFGDCGVPLVGTERLIRALHSRAPLEEATWRVDAKPLLQAWRKHGMIRLSTDVLSCYAEAYFWRSVRKAGLFMDRCPAMRGTVYARRFIRSYREQ